MKMLHSSLLLEEHSKKWTKNTKKYSTLSEAEYIF